MSTTVFSPVPQLMACKRSYGSRSATIPMHPHHSGHTLPSRSNCLALPRGQCTCLGVLSTYYRCVQQETARNHGSKMECLLWKAYQKSYLDFIKLFGEDGSPKFVVWYKTPGSSCSPRTPRSAWVNPVYGCIGVL